MSLRHLYRDLTELGCYPDISMSDKCYKYDVTIVFYDDTLTLKRRLYKNHKSMEIVYANRIDRVMFKIDKKRWLMYKLNGMLYLHENPNERFEVMKTDKSISNKELCIYILSHQMFIKTIHDLRKYIIDYISM